jgi:predicted nucleic acid-binding protein
MTVIANASPLIHLSAIRHLDLLPALFGRVIVPEEVYAEVVIKGAGRPGSREVAEAAWIDCRAVTNRLAMQAMRLSGLGTGEAACLVLAKELVADLLILDDRLARLYAQSLGLRFTGTIGILLRTTELGHIADFEQALQDLLASGFRLALMEVERIRQLWRQRTTP